MSGIFRMFFLRSLMFVYFLPYCIDQTTTFVVHTRKKPTSYTRAMRKQQCMWQQSSLLIDVKTTSFFSCYVLNMKKVQKEGKKVVKVEQIKSQ